MYCYNPMFCLFYLIFFLWNNFFQQTLFLLCFTHLQSYYIVSKINIFSILEVRTATLDSFCKLATHFPSFAATSLDFLVDMFNDETEEVCLKAIHCLQKISLHIMLREDQLKTILVVLEVSAVIISLNVSLLSVLM